MNYLMAKILEPFCSKAAPLVISKNIHHNVRKIFDEAFERLRDTKNEEVLRIIKELEKEIFDDDHSEIA